VEDDPNDVLLFQHACNRAGMTANLQVVVDGDQAVGYLRGSEAFSNRDHHPLPNLILLDLKMPRVNGFDVLGWLRKEDRFKNVPVIVLSSSIHKNDIKRAYALGANSFLVKPVGFDALVDLAKTIDLYWLQLNRAVQT
jgi:CheY-like chemotaxis protein